MKKILLIIIILQFYQILYSETDQFYISEEKFKSTIYTENEYNGSIYYNSDIPFSEGIELYSSTDDVKIYVNGKVYNKNTVKLYDLDLGLYRIKIKKTGYTLLEKKIYLEEGQRIIINFTLGREFGYLNAQTDVNESKFYINSTLISKYMKLPTDKYNLEIKTFGYKTEYKEIEIVNNNVTKVNFNLEKAPFLLENLSIEKYNFNPNAKEGFGLNKIKINVNGPGNGTIIIKNSDDVVVYNKDLVFLNWTNTFIFKGISNSNLTLENGTYKVLIESNNQSLEGSININNNLDYHTLPNYRGFTGLILTPTAELNPININSTSFNINYDLSNNIISFPFSYTGFIKNNINLHSGLSFSSDYTENIMNIKTYLGLFYLYNLNIFSFAINLNYQMDLIDQILENSIIMNVPMTINLKITYITITPEYEVNFNEENELSIGFGFHFDDEKIRTGLSSRVTLLETNITSLYGIEFNYLLPNSQSFIGIGLTSSNELDINLNLNISLLY